MKIPPIYPIAAVRFPRPEELTLKNGIRVFGFNGVQNEIVRLDLVFDAGSWTESYPMQAEFTAHLLKSGTALLNSFEIEEKIDSFGSTVKCTAGYNTITVSVYCMTKYLQQTLAYVILSLNECIFKESELNSLKQRKKAGLSVAQEKNDYIADITFRKLLFGPSHPYGYEKTQAAIDGITSEMLLDYYRTFLKPDNCTVFMAGNYGKKEIDLLDTFIGEWDKPGTLLAKPAIIPALPPFEHPKVHIQKEKSVQSSIVMGNLSIHRMHPDFPAFFLLNTIFGGYFGSRLMSNIREEKGLTYGIHSSMSLLKHQASFHISTDTNLENTTLCLNEIYAEMRRLREEEIPEEEINVARNYILGKFLSRTDGAFNQMESFKSYFIENSPIARFEEITDSIRTLNGLSLQQTAQKYLQEDNMYEVVVG